MEKQSSKNFKNSRVITTVASFLLVGILSALLTINLTMAAFGNINIAGKDYMFGNIVLDDVSNNFSIQSSLGQSLNTVSPGDTVEVTFDLKNSGTAGMFVRFKLVIEDTALENKVDTSIFGISLISSSYFNGQATQNVTYVIYDFDGHDGTIPTGTPDNWYVRRFNIPGADTIELSQSADEIVINIDFPEDMDNSYKSADLDLNLYVEGTQYSNNGTQRDVTLPGYDVIWE